MIDNAQTEQRNPPTASSSSSEIESPYCLIGAGDTGESGDLLQDQKTLQSSLLRLQALLADWLRMENVVVLMGAGCSISSGGKTLAGLEDAVLGAVAAIPSLPPAVQTLLANRLDPKQKASEWSKIGFEPWLSYISNATHLTSKDSSPINTIQWKVLVEPSGENLKSLLDDISRAIFAQCALVLHPPEEPNKGTPIAPQIPFFAKLIARDSNLGRTHVFTSNYDTLIEQALDLLGVHYFDGFSGRARARFDPSVYGLDLYYPGDVAEGKVRRFDKFLHLYKIHGSIHWHIAGDEIIARHTDLTPYVAYRAADNVTKATRLKSENFELEHSTLGIIPTSNKFVQTLDMPYAHLFRALHSRLSVPQTFLLVLGYGFGDEHINRIVETALTNPSLVMLVVEPNADSPTVARIRSYRDLGRRAYILTPRTTDFARKPYPIASFDDFAISVMPHVQWLDDFLRLRRFERQIERQREPTMRDPNE